MTNLYHFTCQHGRDGIGDSGQLLIPREVRNQHSNRTELHGMYAELDGLIWMTDLDRPHREGLGLHNEFTACDRAEHRYVVVDGGAVRYVTVRRTLNRTLADLLESAPGAMPMHWWVATSPVAVEYAPIQGTTP